MKHRITTVPARALFGLADRELQDHLQRRAAEFVRTVRACGLAASEAEAMALNAARWEREYRECRERREGGTDSPNAAENR